MSEEKCFVRTAQPNLMRRDNRSSGNDKKDEKAKLKHLKTMKNIRKGEKTDHER
jgi:hypothetical protein